MAFFLGNLEWSRAKEMLEDPSWTKAVIFRNPLERLVSAYQDKIVRKSYTQKIFGIGTMADENRPVLSFSEFVDKVTNSSDPESNCTYPMGLSACTDPHWKPQLMMCGLDYFLPKFDFVGNFDYVAEHTKALLEKVGVWDTWGRNFRDARGGGGGGANAALICSTPPPPPERYPTNDTGVYGFNQRGPSMTGQYDHRTESKTKLDKFYSTPELIEKVRRAYALDFAVWDEISQKSVSEISHGKDLKVVREYCSTRKA